MQEPRSRRTSTTCAALPGVAAATAASNVPLSGGGSADDPRHPPGARARHRQLQPLRDRRAGSWRLSALQLVAGRNFRHDEIQPPLTKTDASRFVPQIIVSRALAEYLFRQGEPARQTGLRLDRPGGHDHRHRRPGARLLAHQRPPGLGVLRAPRRLCRGGGSLMYLVRTQPGQRDAILRIAEEHLSTLEPRPGHASSYRTLNSFRDLTYLGDRAMSIYLLTVTALLIAVTCLGIFALATFNVSTRTKQIGTRRAVGARRRDIVRYFLVENGLITSSRHSRGAASWRSASATGSRSVRAAATQPLLPRRAVCWCSGGSASSPPGSLRGARPPSHPRSRRARCERRRLQGAPERRAPVLASRS